MIGIALLYCDVAFVSFTAFLLLYLVCSVIRATRLARVARRLCEWIVVVFKTPLRATTIQPVLQVPTVLYMEVVARPGGTFDLLRLIVLFYLMTLSSVLRFELLPSLYSLYLRYVVSTFAL